MLSEKNEKPYHITIAWIRTLFSFEILTSVHTCLRGSRTPFHIISQGDFIDDCRLNATQWYELVYLLQFEMNRFLIEFFFRIYDIFLMEWIFSIEIR